MRAPRTIMFGYAELETAGLLAWIVDTLTARGFIRTAGGSVVRYGAPYSPAKFRAYVRHLTLSHLAYVRNVPGFQPAAKRRAHDARDAITRGHANDALRLLAFLAAERLPSSSPHTEPPIHSPRYREDARTHHTKET